MKTLILALPLFLLLSTQPAEPKYAGIPYAVSEKGDLIELERRSGIIKAKSNIFTSSAKGYYQIEGGKSPVRFKAGETAVFIIRVSNPEQDPESQIRLIRLDSNKKHRKILLSEVSAGVFRSDASVRPLRNLGFDAEKYGSSSFKITLNRGLPPGEYAFDSTESQGLFCFGFDS